MGGGMRPVEWWVRWSKRWVWVVVLAVGLLGVTGMGSWAVGDMGQGDRSTGTQIQALLTGQVGLVPTTGGLRLYNQSPHPLRLVLLSRRSHPVAGIQPMYEEPAHWDFLPWEGRLPGMRVVLAERMLRLQVGDVVLAFAQDGSSQYWGPYVVGETPLPQWEAARQEWQLRLE